MAPDDRSVYLPPSDPYAGPYYIIVENLPDLTNWQNLKDFIRSQFGRKIELYVRLFHPSREKGWIRVLGFSTYKQVTNILTKFAFRDRHIVTVNPGYNDDGSGGVYIRSPLESDRPLSTHPTLPLPLTPPLLQSSSHVGCQDARYQLGPPLPPLSAGSGVSYQILPDGSVVSHITVYPALPFPYHVQPAFPGPVHPVQLVQPPTLPLPLDPYPLPPREQTYWQPPGYCQNTPPERTFAPGAHHPLAAPGPTHPAPHPLPSSPIHYRAPDEEERQVLVKLPRGFSSPAPDKREDIIYAALPSPAFLERVDTFPDYVIATFVTVQAAKLALENLSPLGSTPVRMSPQDQEAEQGSQTEILNIPVIAPSASPIAVPPTPSPSVQQQEEEEEPQQHQQPGNMSTAVVVNGSITPPDSPPPAGLQATTDAVALISPTNATSPPRSLGRPGVLVVNGSTPL